MTLSELKQLDRDVITPAEAASVLGCNPDALRLALRDDPGSLPFPAYRAGSWGKIPKAGFIAWMEGIDVAAVVRETLKELLTDEDIRRQLMEGMKNLEVNNESIQRI